MDRQAKMRDILCRKAMETTRPENRKSATLELPGEILGGSVLSVSDTARALAVRRRGIIERPSVRKRRAAMRNLRAARAKRWPRTGGQQ
jgi:hypothetical protein